MSESSLQANVVRYIKYKYNKVKYCASLGGQYQPYMSQRKKLISNGYVKGFPDIFLYEARGTYFGLAIEIKTIKGVATKEQKQWIVDLNSKGYKASVQKGWDNIINEIDKYMSLPQLIISNEKDKQKATKDK